MTPAERCARIVGRLFPVKGEEDELALLATIASEKGPITVGFVNAHALNLCWDSEDVADAFLSLDILLRDGKGMEMLMNYCSVDPGLNMNGTDFIPKMLECLKERSTGLFGTQDPWLTHASNKLNATYGNVSLVVDGFKDVDEYADFTQSLLPQTIILGMGMPKQEYVAREMKARLKAEHTIVIVCGGAILDFVGGRTTRAPLWMRRSGLEWTFRLAIEPKRLWRRYIIGNILFLSRLSAVRKALDGV